MVLQPLQCYYLFMYYFHFRTFKSFWSTEFLQKKKITVLKCLDIALGSVIIEEPGTERDDETVMV
jgi:hypothetical protein